MADIYLEKDRIKNCFDKLEESDLSNANKQDLRDFTSYLMAEDLSDHKIYRYIQTFRVLSPVIDFNLRDAERKDLIQLVGRINQDRIPEKSYAPESKAELKKAFRRFYKWKFPDREKELIGFISTHVKRSDRKRVDPDQLPSPSQVDRLITEAKNLRDKLMISLLWESGARVGEFLKLDWEDIQFQEDFIRVTLNGKTGQRTIPVVDSRKYLEDWQSYQYGHYDPVFTSLHSESRLSYSACNKAIKRNADKADLECKVNPHAFRKSRATFLASQGANVFQLMEFFGWSQAETAKTYVRLAQSDVDDLVKSVSRRDVHF
ncbi:MAG: site-specific recombinase XerD [Candidatus Nanohaloarchaea archaeon]|jgi:site-specific recombinase XerD